MSATAPHRFSDRRSAYAILPVLLTVVLTAFVACGSGALSSSEKADERDAEADGSVRTTVSPSGSKGTSSDDSRAQGPTTSGLVPSDDGVIGSTKPPDQGKKRDKNKREGEEYGFSLFSLPNSDIPGTTIGPEFLNTHFIYELLRTGRCAEAQEAVDASWNRMLSPQTVLLYQAGVHLCLNDRTAARRVFDVGTRRYGWVGFARIFQDCHLYQAVASVLAQAPRDSFPCPQAMPPSWTSPRADPRQE